MLSRFLLTSKLRAMRPYFYTILAALLCFSCTDAIDDFNNQTNPSNSQNASYNHISEALALNIAESFWGGNQKARSKSATPTVCYVLKNTTLSRHINNLSDTLAYIFNYPENEGFTIVASDNRVNPILAYSDQGQFSFDNEIVKDNFIARIEDYMSAETSQNLIYPIEKHNTESCIVIYPYISESIGQGAPYNKYVTIEHPNCPAGCVAVATANVMIQSLNSKRYRNSHFEFAAIRQAFKEHNPPHPEPISISRIVGPTYPPANPLIKYSYEEAVDSVAKMLYWIGKDVDMDYHPNGSSAFSQDAYNLLKHLSFDILTPGLLSFNLTKVCDYINNDCIIYMRGRDTKKNAGHAWVADGCSFCIETDGTTFNEYVHCDWGWNGLSNGFYNGDVFEAGSYDFSGITYFAIKRHLIME